MDSNKPHSKRRRQLLSTLALTPVAVATQSALGGAPYLPTGAVASARLAALPGKATLLKRSYRPPNYETPLAALNQELTPNEQLFVRWHMASIPEISPQEFRLTLGADDHAKTLSLSLADLKRQFTAVDVTAVCQCAGFRRGYSDPHVPGVQWGHGAVGNATWTGVRLRDVLRHAGIDAATVEVAFRGEDRASLDSTPRFIKSLPTYKALDDQTILAYAMNGKPIPHWNGAPLRLVVPGWVATYWMKQITRIDCLKAPLTNFWMNTAYRLPVGKFPGDTRFGTQANDKTVPITEMVVNSLITNMVDGQQVKSNQPLVIEGVAWDGGSGIEQVEVSWDDGHSWSPATLAKALSRYSFHRFSASITPTQVGLTALRVRAVSYSGQTQTEQLIFNNGGYHNNVPHRIEVRVV
jgi:sulfite dehydrogenase (cytochrome) subunit A